MCGTHSCRAASGPPCGGKASASFPAACAPGRSEGPAWQTSRAFSSLLIVCRSPPRATESRQDSPSPCGVLCPGQLGPDSVARIAKRLQRKTPGHVLMVRLLQEVFPTPWRFHSSLTRLKTQPLRRPPLSNCVAGPGAPPAARGPSAGPCAPTHRLPELHGIWACAKVREDILLASHLQTQQGAGTRVCRSGSRRGACAP